MAFGAGHGLMGRHCSVGGELGLHDVAGGAAKLDGVHVLHRAIAELAGDDYVRDRHHRKEDSHAAPSQPAVLHLVQISVTLRLASAMPIGISTSPAKKTIGIAMKISSPM